MNVTSKQARKIICQASRLAENHLNWQINMHFKVYTTHLCEVTTNNITHTNTQSTHPTHL